MDDVGKITYLVGDGIDRKLKRNIPERLQKLAGKKTFVERLRSIRLGDIKEQARDFAFRTDAELRRLKGLAVRNEPEPTPSEFALSETRARQIALLYFKKADTRNLESESYFIAPDDPDYAEVLSDAAGDAEWALREASGEFRTTPPRALDILFQFGAITRANYEKLRAENVPAGLLKTLGRDEASEVGGWPVSLNSNRDFQFFCRLIERADVALSDRRYRSLNRGLLVPVKDKLFLSVDDIQEADPAPVNKAAPQERHHTIGDLIELFLKSKEGLVSKSRAAQYRIPFRVLRELLGPAFSLGALSRDKCRELLDFLPRIPAHVTQHYKDCQLADAAELYRAETGQSPNRFAEAQKHADVIKSALALAVREGWLAINPMDGLVVRGLTTPRKKHIVAKETYDSFSIEQLNKFFALPLFTGCEDDERGCHTIGPNILRRHRYWAPILALWTGLRMNEILQLERADVQQSEEGIHFIEVTDEEREEVDDATFRKRLKTQNSLRRVPIHEAIERFGFLAWVQKRPAGRLFPEARVGNGEKPSDNYSKRFASNAKEAGVWVSRRLVFHSFRNTFNDALREAGVHLELREAIGGWREQSSIDARYGVGHSLSRINDAIQSIQYRGLAVAHLEENSRR